MKITIIAQKRVWNHLKIMMQSLLSEAPRRTALERRQFTHNAVSQSQTPKLFTRCYTLTYISFQSADCFLCCSQEPIRSGGGDETANSNPDTDDMPMVSLFLPPSVPGRCKTLCTEYGWLSYNLLGTFFLFTESPNMSVLAHRQGVNIQFGN